MALQLEDYALIGDTRSAALVGYDGSLDWLCLPRFDSGACFAALLGTPEHGRWLLAPAGGHRATARRYRDDTLVLETEFTTAEGAVRVVDCMPMRTTAARTCSGGVEGLSGRVRVRSEVTVRLDYGHVVPWFRVVGRRTSAFAGPDALTLDGDERRATATTSSPTSGSTRASTSSSGSPGRPRATSPPRTSTSGRASQRPSAGGGTGRAAAATTGRTATRWSAR